MAMTRGSMSLVGGDRCAHTCFMATRRGGGCSVIPYRLRRGFDVADRTVLNEVSMCLHLPYRLERGSNGTYRTAEREVCDEDIDYRTAWARRWLSVPLTRGYDFPCRIREDMTFRTAYARIWISVPRERGDEDIYRWGCYVLRRADLRLPVRRDVRGRHSPTRLQKNITTAEVWLRCVPSQARPARAMIWVRPVYRSYQSYSRISIALFSQSLPTTTLQYKKIRYSSQKKVKCWNRLTHSWYGRGLVISSLFLAGG